MSKRAPVSAILIIVLTLIAGPLEANSLGVNAGCAMEGNFGLEVSLDGGINKVFVADTSPSGETVYRASFLIRHNGISMVERSGHSIFNVRSASPPRNVILLFFRRAVNRDGYNIIAKLREDDDRQRNKGKLTIADSEVGPVEIQIEWAAGDGSGNGILRMWKRGVLRVDRSDIDNDTWVIDDVRLGAPKGVDATSIGTYCLDDFQSFRTLAP